MMKRSSPAMSAPSAGRPNNIQSHETDDGFPSSVFVSKQYKAPGLSGSQRINFNGKDMASWKMKKILKDIKKAPWFHISADGYESYLAVYPVCDNPIQLIGLYKNTPESGRKPYGKHTNKPIPELARYDKHAYECCSFANKNWYKIGKARRANDEQSRTVLNFLREQFDRVIYIIQQDSGIFISKKTAEEMLRQYIAVRAWTYRESRDNNLPWVMANVDGNRSLFGHLVERDSDLLKAIQEKCPEIQVKGTQMRKYVRLSKRPGDYFALSYHFQEHEFTLSEDDQHMEETICLIVSSGIAEHYDVIYRKKIVIDTNSFIRLCSMPPESAERNERLLEVARAVIPEC